MSDTTDTAAQPQQQPMAHASSRNEAEDGFEAAATNGSGHSNGAERPSQDVSSSDNDLMDADSPQPFIDDMPVIDQEGKVNGASQKAEKAEAGDDEADEKPRRRPRTPRARTPRRASGDQADAGQATAEAADGAEASGGSDEADQPKPRRRVARPRRAKAAEEAPAEAPAGE